MLEKARARGENLVKRQTGLLQGDCPEKCDIEVRTPSRNKSTGAAIQRFHSIERTELAPRIHGEFEFRLDPPCHDGLMISVVYNQRGTSGGRKPGPEPVPGSGGLRKPGVVLGILSIGEACGREGTLAFKLPGRSQPSGVRAVIEVGQRIQKPRRCITGDAFRVNAERRFQKQCIGICRFESIDIEGRWKIIGENTFAKTDRAVKRIVVEKVAAELDTNVAL